MGPKEIYLILYNVIVCVGWSVVFAGAVKTVSLGVADDGFPGALSNVYATEGLAWYLTYSQTAALLEIIHAALGLVRSPVLITAMQVGSRIVALVAVNGSVEAQSKSRQNDVLLDIMSLFGLLNNRTTQFLPTRYLSYRPMGSGCHDLVVVFG